ncbi:MAG: hypothetical protein L3J07_01530 [Candidatus Magasanikbacteria bacterium]|nr:hypothetical protein [Candidatus Magasanikbacteria bacterium]
MSEEESIYINIREFPFSYEQEKDQRNGFVVFVGFDNKYYFFYLFSKQDFDFCCEFISCKYKNKEQFSEALRNYFNSKITLELPESSDFEMQMLEDAAAVIAWGFIVKDEDTENNCEKCPLFADLKGLQPN